MPPPANPTVAPLGAVLSRSYFESLGDDDQSRSDGFISNPNPGTAGPFDLTEFSSGQQIVYTKRPDHFILAVRPYPFDELEINLIAEAATRKAALLSGAADISPIDLDSREELVEAGLQYRFGPESTVIWINAWNCSVDAPQTLGYDQSRDQDAAGQYIGEPKGNPLMCQDKRIRHALDYAIDKEAIQELVGGPDVFHIAGSAGISPSGLGYRPNAGLDPFPFDPAKARDLFVEAGYNVPEAITPDGVTLEAVTNLKDPVYPGGGDEWNVWTWEAGATIPKMLQIVEFVCADWETFLGLSCKVNVGDEAGGQGQTVRRGNPRSVSGPLQRALIRRRIQVGGTLRRPGRGLHQLRPAGQTARRCCTGSNHAGRPPKQPTMQHWQRRMRLTGTLLPDTWTLLTPSALVSPTGGPARCARLPAHCGRYAGHSSYPHSRSKRFQGEGSGPPGPSSFRLRKSRTLSLRAQRGNLVAETVAVPLSLRGAQPLMVSLSKAPLPRWERAGVRVPSPHPKIAHPVHQ